MKRRDFIKLMAASSLVSPNILSASKDFTPYSGELFIIIQANGGWDISSFCDPKDDKNINTWAKNGKTIKTTSNGIRYAPFAKNVDFFEKYKNDILILNGIDTQTNAHSAGIRTMFSGRFDEGYPSFGALFSSVKAPSLPLSYISNGGYNYTASLIQYTLMKDPSSLANLIEPNLTPYGPKYFHAQPELDIIKKYQKSRLDRALKNETLAPRLKKSLKNFINAVNSQDSLALLKEYIPDELVSVMYDNDTTYNPLPRQAQLSLVAMKAGLCCVSDLKLDGFDTHANHNKDHSVALGNLTYAIDFLMSEAERLGLSDRLTVVVSSDFSRTPKYNDGLGKDHWPSASTIFIKKSATWGGKVFGATDDALNVKKVNQNLGFDNADITIESAHIQQALRELSGISNSDIVQRFPLKTMKELNLMQMF